MRLVSAFFAVGLALAAGDAEAKERRRTPAARPAPAAAPVQLPPNAPVITFIGFNKENNEDGTCRLVGEFALNRSRNGQVMRNDLEGLYRLVPVYMERQDLTDGQYEASLRELRRGIQTLRSESQINGCQLPKNVPSFT